MANNIVIRQATVEDAESLLQLNYEFNEVQMDIAEITESLRVSTELIALAMIGDRVAGFACAQYFRSFCYQSLCGEITEMYVREDARRKGIASLLLTFLEDELRARGVTGVKLITGSKNEIAIKAYETNGYIPQDDLVLHKILD